MANPYEVLGVEETANLAAIKKAYRRLARTCHPDLHGRNPDLHERFLQISSAYKTLSNPQYRLFFDAFRRDPATLDFDDVLIEEALHQERESKRSRRRAVAKVSREECPDCEGTGIRASGRYCQSCDPRLAPGETSPPPEMELEGSREGRIRIPKSPKKRTKADMREFFRFVETEQLPTADKSPRASERIRLRPKKK